MTYFSTRLVFSETRTATYQGVKSAEGFSVP